MGREFEISCADGFISIDFLKEVKLDLLQHAFEASSQYEVRTDPKLEGVLNIFRKGNRPTYLASIHTEGAGRNSLLLPDTDRNRKIAKELEGLSEVSKVIKTLVLSLCELKEQKYTINQVITQLKGELDVEWAIEKHEKGLFIKIRFKNQYLSDSLWGTAHTLGWMMRRMGRYLQILGETWPPIAYVSLDGKNCKNIYIWDTPENQKLVEALGIRPTQIPAAPTLGPQNPPAERPSEPEKSFDKKTIDEMHEIGTVGGRINRDDTLTIVVKSTTEIKKTQVESKFALTKSRHIEGLFEIRSDENKQRIVLKFEGGSLRTITFKAANQNGDFIKTLVADLHNFAKTQERTREQLLDADTKNRLERLGKVDYTADIRLEPTNPIPIATFQVIFSESKNYELVYEEKFRFYRVSRKGKDKSPVIILRTKKGAMDCSVLQFNDIIGNLECIKTFVKKLSEAIHKK